MNDGISIRPLTTYDEFLICESIQRQAWKMTDERDVVPAHMLKPIADHGGIVLGAFDEQATLIGFVFGFVGRTDDERAEWIGTPYILCSEMMGVLPEYRSRSVGYRLKLAQREFALRQGYRLMTWTYDPLLSLNANLNICKLGCIVRHYVEDAYGALGGIYAGMSTDRFAIEWWLGSRHVEEIAARPGAPADVNAWLARNVRVVNPSTGGDDGLPRPGNFDLDAGATEFIVEFPSDIQAVKDADMGLAIAWRNRTRELFEAAFKAGYAVMAYGRSGQQRGPCSYYLLSQELDIPSMARGTA